MREKKRKKQETRMNKFLMKEMQDKTYNTVKFNFFVKLF